jgi:hypothetical protein
MNLVKQWITVQTIVDYVGMDIAIHLSHVGHVKPIVVHVLL